MNIPSSLRAGDTWTWTDDLADYPAATYTVKYTFYKYGQAAVTITAVGTTTSHVVTVAVAVTAVIAAGEWGWTAYVEKGAGDALERTTIGSGTVQVKPMLIGATAATDHRSHAQIMLDAIEATLQGRATHADLALTVNGRSIQYMKPDELEKWRNAYRRQVNRENGKSTIVGIQYGSV